MFHSAGKKRSHKIQRKGKTFAENGRKYIMKRSGSSKLLREGLPVFYALRRYEANGDKYG